MERAIIRHTQAQISPRLEILLVDCERLNSRRTTAQNTFEGRFRLVDAQNAFARPRAEADHKNGVVKSMTLYWRVETFMLVDPWARMEYAKWGWSFFLNRARS